MLPYKQLFDSFTGVKIRPNSHELALFDRAQKYIRKLAWIPGIEMIAISNSLSMYATHEDSDIDLFIVTKPGMIWFVRFFVTLRFWLAGVWRHGNDIAGNFCLSFFVTTEGIDLKNIAIENDIYLYYWIYYLKPVFIKGSIYERFLETNSWITLDGDQRMRNQEYRIQEENGKKTGMPWGLRIFPPNAFGTKSTSKMCLYINKLIRLFLLPRTQGSYEKLGRPEGVIISDQMLKFHQKDRRKEIRDAILEKNFDK